MNIDFPLVLVVLTLVSGLIYLIDVLFFAKSRKSNHKPMPVVFEYARSFFPIFVFVLVVRSFIIQPFRVPSGSMEPTILPNDFIAVTQFSYGLRLPVTNQKIFAIGEPKRGDVIVLRYPGDPHINYIKRVVGIPGDHVVYRNQQLSINGKLIDRKLIGDGVDLEEPVGSDIPSRVYEEILDNVHYKILLHKSGSQELEPVDVVVPKDMYFAMGDNRDNSGDSRFFGFVPEENLVGKAWRICFSWAGVTQGFVRWSRVWNKL